MAVWWPLTMSERAVMAGAMRPGPDATRSHAERLGGAFTRDHRLNGRRLGRACGSAGLKSVVMEFSRRNARWISGDTVAVLAIARAKELVSTRGGGQRPTGRPFQQSCG